MSRPACRRRACQPTTGAAGSLTGTVVALQDAHLRLLRQRAEGNAELSEVLAALLYLGERLDEPKRHVLPAAESRRLHENAGRVLDSFLQRVRAAV